MRNITCVKLQLGWSMEKAGDDKIRKSEQKKKLGLGLKLKRARWVGMFATKYVCIVYTYAG